MFGIRHEPMSYLSGVKILLFILFFIFKLNDLILVYNSPQVRRCDHRGSNSNKFLITIVILSIYNKKRDKIQVFLRLNATKNMLIWAIQHIIY